RRVIRKTILLAASARPRVRVTVLRSAWSAPKPFTRTVGDPISMSVSPQERAQFRAAGGLDLNKYWFAVIGAVDERKNADLVAKAVLEQPSRDVGLLVAGKIHTSVRRSLEELIPQFSHAGIDLTLDDRLLTDAELDRYVVACDCLVLAHANEGPS